MKSCITVELTKVATVTLIVIAERVNKKYIDIIATIIIIIIIYIGNTVVVVVVVVRGAKKLLVARWRIRRATVVVWKQSTPEPTGEWRL